MKPLLTGLVLVALAATASADRHRGKPRAPVDVTLQSRPVDGGYQVTLVAVPTHAVATLELRLDGKRVSFAATRAGQRRELTTRIAATAGTGLDVVGSAATGSAGSTRTRAATLRVGVPASKPAEHVVSRTLPNGRVIAEVR